MKLKETRLLAPGKLRQLCISQNWYTCGSNAAYEHLLHDLTHNGRDHMTTEDITRVAQDIMDHSEPSRNDWDLCAIAWNVAAICVSMFQPVANESENLSP